MPHFPIIVYNGLSQVQRLVAFTTRMIMAVHVTIFPDDMRYQAVECRMEAYIDKANITPKPEKNTGIIRT